MELKPLSNDDSIAIIQDVIEKHLNVVDPAHGGKEENNDNEVTDKSDKQESDLYQITNNELR